MPPLKWVIAVLPAQAKAQGQFPGAALVPRCSPRRCCRAAHGCLELPEPSSAHADKAWAQMPTGDTFLSHEWASTCTCHQHGNGCCRCGMLPGKSRSPAGICPAAEVQRGTWGKASSLLNTRPTGVVNAQNTDCHPDCQRRFAKHGNLFLKFSVFSVSGKVIRALLFRKLTSGTVM